jgi:hypothetical protein
LALATLIHEDKRAALAVLLGDFLIADKAPPPRLH